MANPETIASLARQCVEAAASSVEECFTAYIERDGVRYTCVTIGNTGVKPEGEEYRDRPTSMEGIEDTVPKFVEACLAQSNGNKTLVWRRRPAIDEYGDGTFSINARLVWVP